MKIMNMLVNYFRCFALIFHSISKECKTFQSANVLSIFQDIEIRQLTTFTYAILSKNILQYCLTL